MPNINNGILDGVRRIGGRFRDLVVNGGLPGAPLGYRLRGATPSGPPATGTWKAGDEVPDRTGIDWLCTAGGTPGTWVQSNLLPSNNLSDLPSASAARTNLGLTGAATAALPLTITNGGTGAATQQAALDALAGAVTTGLLLRGNGTHVTLAALQASDVPTLNQNTTGTAAGLSSTLAIGSGGTGQVTAAAAYNALSPMTTLGDLEYESGASTASRLAGNTSATKNFLTQTGTGSVSAAPAWGTIASGDLPAATTGAQGAVQVSTATPQPTSTTGATGSGSGVLRPDHVHAQNYAGVFGDGTDGAVTLDGTTTFNNFSSLAGSTYTLTRDVFATSLTIQSGVTLKPAGWRIFCQGAFSNAGTVNAAGSAGTASGTAGAATGQGALRGGIAGGAGGTAAGTAGGLSNSAGLVAGGAGGLGPSGAAGAGGTAGSSGTSWFKLPGAIQSGVISVAGGSTSITGGPGGGGGGGDGTNKGGGGGGGGGVVAIFAWSISNTGTITVQGGAGGTPTTGNAGGGGGGSGGLILGYSLTAWTAGTQTISGGAAGLLVGTGSANGNAGGTGTALNVIVQ